MLAPNEEETLIYENDENIKMIEITDLTESEEECGNLSIEQRISVNIWWKLP